MPETPAPEGHWVHFDSPATTLGGASETQALRHHHGHQTRSQTDPQFDDPFVGPRDNIVANTHSVCSSTLLYKI